MPVTKKDVAVALAEALMRLGKNDWVGVRNYITKAQQLFETWLEDRPEKKGLEKHNAELDSRKP